MPKISEEIPKNMLDRLIKTDALLSVRKEAKSGKVLGPDKLTAGYYFLFMN